MSLPKAYFLKRAGVAAAAFCGLLLLHAQTQAEGIEQKRPAETKKLLAAKNPRFQKNKGRYSLSKISAADPLEESPYDFPEASPYNDLPEEPVDGLLEEAGKVLRGDSKSDLPEDFPEDLPEDLPEDFPEDSENGDREDYSEGLPKDSLDGERGDLLYDLPKDPLGGERKSALDNLPEDSLYDLPEDPASDLPKEGAEADSESDFSEGFIEDGKGSLREDFAESPPSGEKDLKARKETGRLEWRLGLGLLAEAKRKPGLSSSLSLAFLRPIRLSRLFGENFGKNGEGLKWLIRAGALWNLQGGDYNEGIPLGSLGADSPPGGKKIIIEKKTALSQLGPLFQTGLRYNFNRSFYLSFSAGAAFLNMNSIVWTGGIRTGFERGSLQASFGLQPFFHSSFDRSKWSFAVFLGSALKKYRAEKSDQKREN